MKKSIVMALLLTGVLAVAACGEKEKKEEPAAKQEETVKEDDDTEEETTESRRTSEMLADVDVDSIVELGEYKGITVDKVVRPVMEEEINNKIKYDLQEFPVEVTEGAAQEGDIVDIAYVGKVDGEEFEGGSSESTALVLGSHRFIEGFEEGLIGALKEETRVLNLKFPEEYNPELAGKDVEFTVTVNKISRPLAEPTDEWVAANIEGATTVQEYKDALYKSMEDGNLQDAQDQVRYAAWQKVVESSKIKEYPEELVEMGKNLYYQQAEQYAYYAQKELKDFVEESGMTMEEFEANADEYGKNIAAQALVNQAICNAENFTIGDEEYQTRLKELAETYTSADEDMLVQNYGLDNIEQTIMLNRVTDLILENAVINEVYEEADETTEEEAAAESEETEEPAAEE